MPAFKDEPTNHSFAGRFVVSAERDALVLTRSLGDLRLTFNAVTHHDLPAALEGIRVEAGPHDSAAAASFRLHSAAGSHSVNARSLQIHERATALYGSVIVLPHYALGERLQWSLLLWGARFGWGQALIAWLRGGDRR